MPPRVLASGSLGQNPAGAIIVKIIIVYSYGTSSRTFRGPRK